MFRALACSLLVLAACTTSSETPSSPDASAPDASAPDAGGDGAAHPTACNTPYDCAGTGLQTPCCTNHVCVTDDGTYCANMTAENVFASDYDQSCASDDDCVAVAEGNGCNPGAFDCSLAAINVADHAKYLAAVAKTHAASCYAPANCPAEIGPCCVAGRCTAGAQCVSSGMPDAAADTGSPDAADGAADAATDAAQDAAQDAP